MSKRLKSGNEKLRRTRMYTPRRFSSRGAAGGTHSSGRRHGLHSGLASSRMNGLPYAIDHDRGGQRMIRLREPKRELLSEARTARSHRQIRRIMIIQESVW